MTVRVRLARKSHWCTTCRDDMILPGELHLEHMAYPGEEGAEEITRPWRMRECRPCAEQCGRGGLFPESAGVTS